MISTGDEKRLHWSAWDSETRMVAMVGRSTKCQIYPVPGSIRRVYLLRTDDLFDRVMADIINDPRTRIVEDEDEWLRLHRMFWPDFPED